MTTTAPDAAPATTQERGSRAVIVSAVAVPIMIVGQFAMLAVVPVLVALVVTFRRARLRPLRWWAVGLAVAYALPLVAWAVGPDRAPSLSKDIHPALAALVIAAAVAVAVRYLTLRKSGQAAKSRNSPAQV